MPYSEDELQLHLDEIPPFYEVNSRIILDRDLISRYITNITGWYPCLQSRLETGRIETQGVLFRETRFLPTGNDPSGAARFPLSMRKVYRLEIFLPCGCGRLDFLILDEDGREFHVTFRNTWLDMNEGT